MSVGHYENFPVASLLLPRELRAPVAVIYHFARSADDFADEGDAPPAERLRRLQDYRTELARIEAGTASQNPLFFSLAGVIRRHGLPLQPFRDLLDAFSQDVTKQRYADYAEVLDYCRRSANPVGRLLLVLFRRDTPESLRQSDAICSALQLINFWQDVDVDFRTKDRIYLPQADMRRFEVTEEHLAGRRCDAAFQSLLRFQVDRARELMLSGKPLLSRLEGRFRLEIAVTVEGGLRILEKLEHARYDVFRRRPVHRWFDWPLIFWRAL